MIDGARVVDSLSFSRLVVEALDAEEAGDVFLASALWAEVELVATMQRVRLYGIACSRTAPEHGDLETSATPNTGQVRVR